MLQVESLTKSFRLRTAVQDLGFTLSKGEILGFLGRNGAGKTTSMRMISGVLTPDEGDAIVHGYSIVDQRREAQRHIGYLPETAPLYTDLTAREFLSFLSDCHGLSPDAKRQAIDRVIADSRISTVLNQPIGTLSKGYRRRVGLAGAMLHDPDILILDEPLDGLDPVQKRAVRALISRLAETKAILISTHVLEDVSAICSRLLIIDQGKVITDTEPAALAATHSAGLEEAFVQMVQSHERRAT